MEEVETKRILAKNISRFAAHLLDISFLLPLIALLASVISYQLISITPKSHGMFGGLTDLIVYIATIILVTSIVSYIIKLIYFGILLAKKGQTYGMKILGVKLIKKDNSFLSLKESFARVFIFEFYIFILPALPLIPFIGPLICLFLIYYWFFSCLSDPESQNPYDKVYQTLYISDGEKVTRAKWIVGINVGCAVLLILAVLTYLLLEIILK